MDPQTKQNAFHLAQLTLRVLLYLYATDPRVLSKGAKLLFACLRKFTLHPFYVHTLSVYISFSSLSRKTDIACSGIARKIKYVNYYQTITSREHRGKLLTWAIMSW